jgi:hypothetical protein
LNPLLWAILLTLRPINDGFSDMKSSTLNKLVRVALSIKQDSPGDAYTLLKIAKDQNNKTLTPALKEYLKFFRSYNSQCLKTIESLNIGQQTLLSQGAKISSVLNNAPNLPKAGKMAKIVRTILKLVNTKAKHDAKIKGMLSNINKLIGDMDR